jgi:hypothetical protein
LRNHFFTLFFVLLACSVPVWSDDTLQPDFHFHSWGPELDLAWQPVVLLPGTQTTFWLGGEALYKTWNDFHDPAPGSAPSSDNLSAAAVSEINGSWFLGMTQGLVGQPATTGPEHRDWMNPNLVEVFGYYRGTLFHTLSSGSNLADSSLPDKNGYLQTAFLGGVDLNLLTKSDGHNLKQGFILEGAGEAAPSGLQSVGVDYTRVTAIWTGFLPLYDADPARRLNTFSVLGGLNLAADHLWGNNIPIETRQLIGGRSWDGVMGLVDGVGGAVRGVYDGQFDGATKYVANLDLRFNLPGFDFPVFVQNLSPIKLAGSLVPGFLVYEDFGSWSDLPGLSSGSITTAGLGFFLRLGELGSISAYWNLFWDDWISSGENYPVQRVPITANLDMQF